MTSVLRAKTSGGPKRTRVKRCAECPFAEWRNSGVVVCGVKRGKPLIEDTASQPWWCPLPIVIERARR